MTSNPGTRPRLSFWQLWNMCFGFLGIQFGFALQNSNASRIFQTLGAKPDELPILWVAAPLTGLLVQPVIGYFSDRTWTRLGRRRPYFLVGALLASVALLAMPNSPALWFAAGTLWIMDASMNISMEPFRAFVGDQLPPAQRSAGYAMQSFFIGVGSVIASLLPFLLRKLHVSEVAVDAAGRAIVPQNVRWSFYAGGVVMLLAILWTIFRTREYPPEQLHGFADNTTDAAPTAKPAGWLLPVAALALLAGAAGAYEVHATALDQQLYIVCALLAVGGIAVISHLVFRSGGFFGAVMDDLLAMPSAMRRLVPVQFFSWIALFAMWIYTTGAVTAVHFGSSDPTSKAYNEGADWVGVMFAAYNGFAALYSIAIPWLTRRVGLRAAHLINLWLGALGFASFFWIRDPDWLLLSMVGVGIAWASILSLPYALLSDSLPAKKMGVYMGIFNFFVVIPQLLAASVLGFIVKSWFGNQSIWALAIGAACFVIAGLFSLRVPQPATH